MRSWRMLCASLLATGGLALAAVPAAAQTTQSGLVNVNVSDVYVQAPINVQVPVGIAANVCNVPVAVLAQQANTGSATCDATTTSTALNNAMTQQMVAGGGGGPTAQSGLVNVNVSNLAVQLPVNVQVPVGIAANVCNVPVSVLAQQANTGSATCDATTTSTALNNAMTQQMVAGGGGGPTAQSGLVNVNVSNLAVQLPVNVQVPIGVAANVCNVPVAVLANQMNSGGASCTASSTSTALNQAVARQLILA